MNNTHLRKYQQEAIEAILSNIEEGKRRNLLHIVSGAGRGTVIAETLNQIQLNWPKRSILLLCASKAEEDQLKKRVSESKNLYTDILSSVINRFDKHNTEFVNLDYDIIIITDFTTSEKLVAFLDSYSKSTQIAFSSLAERSVYFGNLIFKYSIKNAINDGVFVPLHINRFEIDVPKFRDSKTNEILLTEDYFNSIASIVVEKTRDEKTIVYCPSIVYARQFCDQINKLLGSKNYARVVSSDLTSIRGIIDNYTNGETGPRLLCIVDMMHFSLPMTKNVVILRPTQSPIVIQNMLRPGLAQYPNKKQLDVYDFVEIGTTLEKMLTDEVPEIQPEQLLNEQYFRRSQVKFRDRKDIDGVLGVDILSEELAEIVGLMPNEPGSMVGIFGKWGRGKTFLVDQTWKLLEKKQMSLLLHGWEPFNGLEKVRLESFTNVVIGLLEFLKWMRFNLEHFLKKTFNIKRCEVLERADNM